MKVWCLQISLIDNQILDRFLPYEARAEIGWLFGTCGDTKILRFPHLRTFPICKRCLKFIFSIIYRILRVQFETLEPKIVADICVIYSSYVIPTKTKKTYLSLYDFD